MCCPGHDNKLPIDIREVYMRHEVKEDDGYIHIVVYSEEGIELTTIYLTKTEARDLYEILGLALMDCERMN